MNVVLIIAHHSIKQGAFKGFEALLDELRHRLNNTRISSTSLLDFEEDLCALLKEDVDEVTILPYLLLNGIHCKEDIPAVIKKMQSAYPQVKINLLPCIGEMACFNELLVKEILNASKIKVSETHEEKRSYSPYLSIEIAMENKNVLVVGGGRIATRKVKTILPTGAKIKIVAPEIAEELKVLAKENENQIDFAERAYERSDLMGMTFAFICTDQPLVNAAVRNDAYSRRVWVNNACDFLNGDFIVPARLDFGENISVTVSTQGKNPSITKQLKNYIKENWATDLKRIEGSL